MTSLFQLAPGVQLSRMDTSTMEETYLAQLPDGQRFQLSPQLYHLLECMMHSVSLAELAKNFQQRTGQALSEDKLTYIIEHMLHPQGLLAGGRNSDINASRQSSSALALHFNKKLIQARHLYPISQALTAFYNPFLVITLLILVVVAHITTYAKLGIPPQLDSTKVPLFWVYTLTIISGLWHEMGHLSACQKWQCGHGSLGIGLYFFSPVFYVDVSSAWQLSRWKRVTVDLGGIYFHLLFTICLCATYFVTQQTFQLWVIVAIDIMILMNLNPLAKMDGYWLLSDIIGIPNLHKRTGETLRYIVISLLQRIGLSKDSPTLNNFGRVRRSTETALIAYTIMSVLIWPLALLLLIPTLFQVLLSYPGLWQHSILNLVDAFRIADFATIGLELGHLLFPLFILANLAVLMIRLVIPLKNFFARRIAMNDKTRWIFVGSSIGFLVATLAIGLTLLVLRPNLQKPDIGGLPIGEVAPDFEAVTVEGEVIRLSDFQGHPVLLKFWSPECLHCVNEMPVVKEAYDRFSSNIIFLTVAAQTPVNVVESFSKEQDIDFPVILDPEGTILRLYQIKRIPFTYLIAPDGKIQSTLIGTQTLEELEQELEACQKCNIQLP